MKTILIAYDGSDCSEAIITELERAGLPSKLEAHVVAVAEVWTAPSDNPEGWAAVPTMLPAVPSAQAQTAKAMQDASVLAEQGAARLKAAFPQWHVGWRVESSGYVGSPSLAIVRP